MYDRSIPYVHLSMYAPRLNDIKSFDIPEGCAMRTYMPGDEEHWARIEMTAGEFEDIPGALEGFERYYGADRALLPGRMFFIIDEHGIPAATATAWFSGKDPCLHWVAVREDMQRRGLARPVIAASLKRMAELGGSYAVLGTQPSSWVAIKLYLEFGFLPLYSPDEKVLAGWDITYQKLGKVFDVSKCARFDMQ